MNIFPIRTEADYNAALARIELFMNTELNNSRG